MSPTDCTMSWYNQDTKKSIPFFDEVVKLRDSPTTFDIVPRSELEKEERKERKRVLLESQSWSQHRSESTGKLYWFNRQSGVSIYEENAVVVLADNQLQVFHREKLEENERDARKRVRHEVTTAARMFVKDAVAHLRETNRINIAVPRDGECHACLLTNVRQCATWLSLGESRQCLCNI